MRKVIVIFALIIVNFCCAQNPENRFSASEEQQILENSGEKEPHIAEAPGPPGGDDLPIDDYLPLLLVTAVGIIVHAGWRKRKQTA